MNRELRTRSKNYSYFCFHDTLTYLYNTDNKIKKIINKLTITQDLSHAPLWKKPYPALTRENIDKQPLVYKRPPIKKEIYDKYLDNELSLQTRENYTPDKKTMPIWLIILIIGSCILVIVSLVILFLHK